MNVLIAFVITMVVLLVALIKLKVSPGVALFACAVLMALLCGIPLADTLGYLTSGFGGIMTSIGLLIIFGGIFGMMLGDSGGMEELAKGLLRTFGKKNDMLALNLAGYIVSIPVYFGSAYITLSPLVSSLQKFTRKKTSAYVAALFTGLLLTHCIVAPTPGPLAVAGQIGANVGWFIIYGIIVSLPASLLCGWQYANALNRRDKVSAEAAKAEAEAIVKAAEAKAEDTAKNSMTEIALAGKQAVARIKEEISSLIAAESTFSAVKAANLDPEFVKAMLLSVARNWNGASSSKVELQALLPEAERAKFDAAFAAAAKELLEAGIEVGYSKEVRTGFKVGAKEGGYYISFADADIEALLAEYLRDKVFQLLFKA